MQNPFPVHHSPHVCNEKWNIPICVIFTCNWLDWTGLGLGLGFVVFGLGLITDFWSRSRSRSRSRTLWSRSWPWSHYVLVSLTSLVRARAGVHASDGSEFQVCRAATEEDGRTNSVRVLRVLETSSSGASDDRRRRIGTAVRIRSFVHTLVQPVS